MVFFFCMYACEEALHLHLICDDGILGDWWAGYGYEIPTLQRVAIRLLSQPCSSHWCRWNWTTFESIHTKKRNKAELEKLNDLVFVHCNLWLQAFYQGRDAKCKPVIYDEINIGSVWPAELEPSTPSSR